MISNFSAMKIRIRPPIISIRWANLCDRRFPIFIADQVMALLGDEFAIEYVANNYGVELSPGRDAAVIKQCLDLKQHVMKTMDLNKYSIVDMSRLFPGSLPSRLPV